jgi:hypothetical protein
LGLIVLREFIRTIYHEVEIHESGAFEMSALNQFWSSLARFSESSALLKRLARKDFSQASDLCDLTLQRERGSRLDKSFPKKVQN